jgi:hypothetical protein
MRRLAVPLLLAAAAALVAVPALGAHTPGGRAWRAERVTDPPPGPTCCGDGDGSHHDHAHGHPHDVGAHHHHDHAHPHRAGVGHHHPY